MVDPFVKIEKLFQKKVNTTNLCVTEPARSNLKESFVENSLFLCIFHKPIIPIQNPQENVQFLYFPLKAY